MGVPTVRTLVRAPRWPVPVVVVALLVVYASLVGCAPSVAPPAAISAPVATDPAAYQDTLSRLDAELAAALARVGQARDPDDLEQATLAAAGMSSSAGEQLRGVPVDDATRRAHDALALGLGEFGRELAYLSQRVYEHEICTGPTALAAIGTAPSMPALRAISAGLGLPGADGRTYRWGAALPVQTSAPSAVPLVNGALPLDRRPTADRADGVLEVVNEGSEDAVVLLGRDGVVAVSVVASAGASTRVAGIPDGDYDLGYTTGRDWDPGLAAFGRDCGFRRFSAPTSFRTTPVAGGTALTVRTVVLRPGPPNEMTVDVPARELPR